jgi:hypothetical protein
MPTPNYTALRSWLDHPDRVDLPDIAAAEAYTAETVTVREPRLTRMAVRNWGARSGARAAIRRATTADNPTIASIALAVEDFMAGGDYLDMDDPNNQAMLGALVQGGVLTASQRDSFLALTERTVPLYSQPGEFGVPATEHDIAHARSL